LTSCGPSEVEFSEREGEVTRIFPFLTYLVLALSLFTTNVEAARIKELVNVGGVRTNQLIGYGLVVGLNGTGDKSNTIFTTQSLANMLERLGLKVDPTAVKVNNVAAVMVTADLPAFSKVGNKIDAMVSSMGDAKSLEGGTLLLTPLRGADGEVYAVAQGPMVVGGFSAGGQAATVQKNHPTVGRVANGVTIEKEIEYGRFKGESILVSLKSPDFTNARRVAERINEVFPGSAAAENSGTIVVSVPQELMANPVKFVSIIENLDVNPDPIAKIVVDEKTGTIVMGENVRISTVGISHGNISIQIKEDEKVSQPMPFSQGRTAVTPDTSIKVEEEKGHFVILEQGVTIKELVNGLNAIGVSTRDLIVILQTIKAAGALHADLEVI
jgi:flagellar P-ring protein precursor FlgI